MATTVEIVRSSFERGGRKAFIRSSKARVPKQVIKASETPSFTVYHYGAHTYLVPKRGRRLKFV